MPGVDVLDDRLQRWQHCLYVRENRDFHQDCSTTTCKHAWTTMRSGATRPALYAKARRSVRAADTTAVAFAV
jgi:hypothetical protein